MAGPDSNDSTINLLPRRRLRVLAGLAVALALYTVAGFASAGIRHVGAVPATLAPELPTRYPEVVRGVMSVHSEASHDAEGRRDEVAASARRVGLDFVVLGDHTRRQPVPADPPAYLDEVLVIDGRELVVRVGGDDVGRLLVFGLDTAVFRWEGSLADLSDRLRRSRAVAMVVHGRSPRPHERWRVPAVDGIAGWEVLDVSEMGRRRLRTLWAPFHIADLVTGLPVGFGHWSILRLNREGFDAPGVLGWDSLATGRTLTATAGLNHHPKVRILGMPFPGYGPFFGTAVNHVLLGGPLPDDATAAADSLAAGFRRGSVFISLGDSEGAAGFRFAAAADDGAVAEMQEWAPFYPGWRLCAGVEGLGTGRVVYRVVRNGRTAAWVRGPTLEWPVPAPGSYRVEVYRYRLRLGDWFAGFRPWIFANPIHLEAAAGSRVAAAP